ncbi:hypothetical protein HW555_003957 [Spodoptera exigua]|uniref:Uncharacterized protein n=1 Tax=Spodoptera exigua TaxID=7107 RepID=A0A835L6I6_SPOEX|nr:hypothetical protein HW555_003957 [Spodoptera exigua]
MSTNAAQQIMKSLCVNSSSKLTLMAPISWASVNSAVASVSTSGVYPIRTPLFLHSATSIWSWPTEIVPMTFRPGPAASNTSLSILSVREQKIPFTPATAFKRSSLGIVDGCVDIFTSHLYNNESTYSFLSKSMPPCGISLRVTNT